MSLKLWAVSLTTLKYSGRAWICIKIDFSWWPNAGNNHCSCRTFNGPHTAWPNKLRGIKSKRLLHSIADSKQQKANTLIPVSIQYEQSMFLNVWWKRSRAPCDSGWKSLEAWWLICNSLATWVNSGDMNFELQSIYIHLGILKVVQNYIYIYECFALMVLDLRVHTGIASGKWVTAHMRVSK